MDSSGALLLSTLLAAAAGEEGALQKGPKGTGMGSPSPFHNAHVEEAPNGWTLTGADTGGRAGRPGG